MNIRFYTTTSADGTITVTAAGEIDLATAGQFHDALTHAGADRDRLIIDLTAVEYLDSAGIRVLYEFLTSHTLELLVHPGTIAATALEISGLADVVTIRHPGGTITGQSGPPT